MTKSCEAKSSQLQQEIIFKLGKASLLEGGSKYICHNCATRVGFHVGIVETIKNKHGDQSCELC